MLLFLLAVLSGAAVGLACGGRVGALADLRLRAPALVGVGLVVQAGLDAPWVPAAWRSPALVASYVLVGAWLVVNLVGRVRALRVAFGVVAVGWALNLLPVAANGAMPVSRPAMAAAGFAGADVADVPLAKRTEAGPSTTAAWMGDVVPVPPLAVVVSLGDLVMILGIAGVVAAGTLPPSPSPSLVRSPAHPASRGALAR